jgi:hypothetical protein
MPTFVGDMSTGALYMSTAVVDMPKNTGKHGFGPQKMSPTPGDSPRGLFQEVSEAQSVAAPLGRRRRPEHGEADLTR